MIIFVAVAVIFLGAGAVYELSPSLGGQLQTATPSLSQPDNRAGQVLFTTDVPTSASAAACQFGHRVTAVTAGTPVYANFFYKSRLTNETVTLTVIKDGTVLTTSTLTNDQANGIDCLESSANLSNLDAGMYEFKLTTANGDTVSDGTLTVK